MRRLTFACVLNALILLTFCLPGYAQNTPAPSVDSWTITAGAVNIPGSNNTTLPGTLAGLRLAVTPDFSVEQVNFISSAAQTNAFMGGGNYVVQPFSKWLNNLSPNLSGYDFRLSLFGDAGAARISQPSGVLVNAVAGLVGGQLDYAVHGSKSWSLGIRVGDFIAGKGLPHRNNLVVAINPAFHF